LTPNAIYTMLLCFAQRIGELNFWLSCLGPLGFLLPKTFRLLAFICFGIGRTWWLCQEHVVALGVLYGYVRNTSWHWAYLMVMSETRRGIGRTWWLCQKHVVALGVLYGYVRNTSWHWAYLMAMSETRRGIGRTWWLCQKHVVLTTFDIYDFSFWWSTVIMILKICKFWHLDCTLCHL
jgi:hypothetical protein